MPIKRSGWSPKKEVTQYEKNRLQNPRKIENAENYLRKWQNYVDDGAMKLNDTENGEGNAFIKKTGVGNYVDTVMKRKLNKVQTDLRRKKK